jgi:hypothetical protein
MFATAATQREVTLRDQGPKEPQEEWNPSMNGLLAVTEPRYIQLQDLLAPTENHQRHKSAGPLEQSSLLTRDSLFTNLPRNIRIHDLEVSKGTEHRKRSFKTLPRNKHRPRRISLSRNFPRIHANNSPIARRKLNTKALKPPQTRHTPAPPTKKLPKTSHSIKTPPCPPQPSSRTPTSTNPSNPPIRHPSRRERKYTTTRKLLRYEGQKEHMCMCMYMVELQ